MPGKTPPDSCDGLVRLQRRRHHLSEIFETGGPVGEVGP